TTVKRVSPRGEKRLTAGIRLFDLLAPDRSLRARQIWLDPEHGALASFRGVGGTEGSHGEGDGETDDLVTVAKWGGEEHPGLPLALVGFSFDAYVQAKAARKMAEEAFSDGRSHKMVAHQRCFSIGQGERHQSILMPRSFTNLDHFTLSLSINVANS